MTCIRTKKNNQHTLINYFPAKIPRASYLFPSSFVSRENNGRPLWCGPAADNGRIPDEIDTNPGGGWAPAYRPPTPVSRGWRGRKHVVVAVSEGLLSACLSALARTDRPHGCPPFVGRKAHPRRFFVDVTSAQH